MKEYRCRKLQGKVAPKSCHVLNGRKPSCPDLMEQELTGEQAEQRIDELTSRLTDTGCTHNASELRAAGQCSVRKDRWEEFEQIISQDLTFMQERILRGVLDIGRLMYDESRPLERRHRLAYDRFQEQDHSGATAHAAMRLIRRLCVDGDVLADEIEDFKFDPERERYELERPWRERQRKIHEREMSHRVVMRLTLRSVDTDEVVADLPVFTTNTPLFRVQLPYCSDRSECLQILQHASQTLGMCYGEFNGVPMFSFDTPETFHLRQHNGLTEADYDEFRAALFSRKPEDEGKAEKILKERTWKHLGKR